MRNNYDPTNDALLRPELGETVFTAGMTASVTQLAVEAARLAYYRFDQSTGEKKRLDAALDLAGFGPARTFSAPFAGTQAFGAVRASDGTALLAFRGTQADKLADLGSDANALLDPWSLGTGRVHAGFENAYLAVNKAVEAWLNDGAAGSSRLIVCGHSLGAALACLCASIVRPLKPTTELVTLGGPRVGDAAFLASLAGVPWTRIVDCCDLVTRVPPEFLSYRHPPFRTYIDREGTVHDNPTDDFVAADREVGRIDYLTKHTWQIGTVLVRDLADHAPANYVKAWWR